MTRNKSEWPAKVLALVRGGNLPAAIAQIKVAPTVGDVTRLQTLLAQLPPSPALAQLNKVVGVGNGHLARKRAGRSIHYPPLCICQQKAQGVRQAIIKIFAVFFKAFP